MRNRIARPRIAAGFLACLLAGCDSTPTRPVVIREPIEVRVPVPVMPPVPAELAGALTIDPRLRVVAPSDPAAVVGLTEEGVRGLRRTVIECQGRDSEWRAAWGRPSP